MSVKFFLYVQTHTVLRWTKTHWRPQSRTVPRRQESARTSHQGGTPQNSATQHNVYMSSHFEKTQPTNTMQLTATGCSPQVVAVVTLRQRQAAHHSDSLRLDHDLRRDGGEVGQVGQHVHNGHYRQGYDDSQRQVPMMGGYGRGHILTNNWSVIGIAFNFALTDLIPSLVLYKGWTQQLDQKDI